jgi:hypothetical protein
MITFVDLTFSPDGEYSGHIVGKLQRIEGVTSVMGEHDVMFHWTKPEEFERRMRAIQKALVGTGATFRIFTVEDSYQSRDPVPWIPPYEAGPSHHPAYPEEAGKSGSGDSR